MVFIIGHRGASKEAPENTLESLSLAIDLQADGVEFDVQLSLDGVPVIIHDHSLRRTTHLKQKQLVSHTSLKELKQLDAGSWFHPNFKGAQIPTLKEALDLLYGHTNLMIELKSYSKTLDEKLSKSVGHLVEDYIHKSPSSRSLWIGSFSASILKRIKADFPQLSLIGIAESQSELDHHIGIGINNFALHQKLFANERISHLQRKDHHLLAWTVDSPTRAKTLIHQGATGIITNDLRWPSFSKEGKWSRKR